MAKAERSPHRCRVLCLRPAVSLPTSFTACMAAVGPAPAKVFGNTAASTAAMQAVRSEEHTSELQSPYDLVCRLLLEKKKKKSVGRRKSAATQTARCGIS